jgi:two-component system sensor histidine kinase ChvG
MSAAPAGGGRGGRLARWLSRISIRLLAFNVLLVFLPAAAVLTLDTYERQLLVAQERSMVQQGRLLAAALSGGDGLATAEAERVLVQLDRRLEARLRVVDPAGRVVADSAALGPRREPGEAAEAPAAVPGSPGASPLYRLGTLLNRAWRAVAPPPELPLGGPGLYSAEAPGGVLSGPAVALALAGRYGADLRVTATPEGAVTTLHSAIPVLGGSPAAGDPRPVLGAVLVSQSTGRVLAALREVRLAVFRVFVASVAAAVVLSLLVATTILRPIGRLRREARAIVDRRGRLTGGFGGSRKLDEIGDLARALEELTGRLRRHLAATEAFAADVSHEFKNPLAAIRSATEMLAEATTPEERRRFEALALREVARLERLLSAVRQVSAIDAGVAADDEERVEVGELLASVVEAFRLRGGPVELVPGGEPLVVRAAPERLAQVVESLLDNALSFSPPGGAVRVESARRDRHAVVAVSDGGPGIHPEHLERVFDRFFSFRPASGPAARDGHAGLGLAIARSIVEGCGGSLRAANRPGGGARFEVELPLA